MAEGVSIESVKILTDAGSVGSYPYVCPECGRGHLGAYGLEPQPCDNCQGEFAQAVGMST